MIRLFAAAPIPDAIAEGLARHQHGLPGAKWRPRETLHITLRFFGGVPEDVAADLDEELRSITGAPFDLTLEGVGTFGEGADIRALWAGVTQSQPLRVLAGRCEAAARRAGLKAETRQFKPHVTLAYLRRPDPAPVGAWVQTHNLLKSPPFQISGFGLWSSWPSGEGSRYELEREYPLGAASAA